MRQKLEARRPEWIEAVLGAKQAVLRFRRDLTAKAVFTPEMRERFNRCAPATLARCSPAYLSAMWILALQWIVLGAAGLVGLFLWKWPPFDLLLLLVAACAVGILVDTLRRLLARKALNEQVERTAEPPAQP